jgi:hypothetical protein
MPRRCINAVPGKETVDGLKRGALVNALKVNARG